MSRRLGAARRRARLPRAAARAPGRRSSSTAPSSTASAPVVGRGHHARRRMHAFWLTLEIVAIARAAQHGLRRRRGARCSCAAQLPRQARCSTRCIDLPFAVSPVVVGLALILVYGRTGWFGGWLADHGIQVIFSVPGHGAGHDLRLAAVRRARGRRRCCARSAPSRSRPPRRSARSAWQTFWRITLPAIRWGVAYGVVLTTARALGEFGAVSVVSGQHRRPDRRRCTLLVEERFENFDLTGAYAAVGRCSRVMALADAAGR